MSFDLALAGKRVVVTGGTRGVGAAVVALLSSLQARIVATARSAPESPVAGVRYVAADLPRPKASTKPWKRRDAISVGSTSWSTWWADRRRPRAVSPGWKMASGRGHSTST